MCNIHSLCNSLAHLVLMQNARIYKCFAQLARGLKDRILYGHPCFGVLQIPVLGKVVTSYHRCNDIGQFGCNCFLPHRRTFFIWFWRIFQINFTIRKKERKKKSDLLNLRYHFFNWLTDNFQRRTQVRRASSLFHNARGTG